MATCSSQILGLHYVKWYLVLKKKSLCPSLCVCLSLWSLSHFSLFAHTHACTLVRTQALVPSCATNAAHLICFDDCFLNRISSFQHRNGQNGSVLSESRGGDRSTRTASGRPARTTWQVPSQKKDKKIYLRCTCCKLQS